MARSWLVAALLVAATSLAEAAPHVARAGHHGYGCIPPPQVFLGAAWLPILAFLFAAAIDRRCRIRRTRGEVISLLHADDVARIVARNALLMCALAVVAVIMLRDSDHEILAFAVAPLALISGCRLAVARFVMIVLDRPATRIERREDWLYVDNWLLPASPRIFAKARQLPRACNVAIDRSRPKP